jgi:limonene-1,2-epoxide hydrolase
VNVTGSDVVRAFIAAWNANDLDAVVSFLDEDVFYHNVPVQPIRGRAAVEQYLRGAGPWDRVDWQLLSIAENGSTVLTERIDAFVIRGRHVSLPLMGAFEIENGRITSWRDYFDLQTYVSQLGDAGRPGPAVGAGRAADASDASSSAGETE